MKTTMFKRMLVLAFSILAISSVYAFDPIVKFVGDKKIAVLLSNEVQKFKFSLKDLKGHVVSEDMLAESQSDQLKTFNLSNFSNGSYILEIEGDVVLYSFPVFIAADKVSSSVSVSKVLNKPLAIEKGNKVHVSMYNPEKAPLHVVIYNGSNDVIYDEKLGNSTKLDRVYDFSQVAGDYKIQMRSNERTYIRTVSIGD
jgi:hypothetical protein